MLRARVPLLSVLLVAGFFGGFALAGRGSGGTYSLPAGNPVVSGTTITSTWANNTLSDLATGLTDSLDRQGRGGMLAPLQCSSGSALAPGLTFSAEPTSGLYRQASGDIRFAVTGTHVWRWATAGNASAVPLSVTGRTTTTNLTVTGSSEALVITPTTTNAVGLYVTGNNSGSGILAVGGADAGYGVVALGGGSSGHGILTTGAGSGAGILANGGSVSGNGITAAAQAGNSRGGVFTGHGTGEGIYSQGGASSGGGGQLVGGAPNGYGVRGDGAGTGAGVVGVGGASGPGVTASAGTAATGGTRQDAITVTNGDISLDGVTIPSATTVIKNRVTPMNIPKAWAMVTMSGATATVDAAFNIFSATPGATNAACIGAGKKDQVVIDYAQPFANLAHIVMLQPFNGGSIQACEPYILSQSASSITIGFRQLWTDTATSPANFAIYRACSQDACGSGRGDWNTATTRFYLVAYGEQ